MMSRWRRSASRERGSMAIEVVFLVPILILVLLLVVAFGRFVDRKADVEAMARDAARAATLERTYGEAQAAANTVVSAAQGRLYDGATCYAHGLTSDDPAGFVAGAIISVTVECQLPWDGLAPLGVPGSIQIGAEAQSPLDQWRRAG